MFEARTTNKRKSLQFDNNWTRTIRKKIKKSRIPPKFMFNSQNTTVLNEESSILVVSEDETPLKSIKKEEAITLKAESTELKEAVFTKVEQFSNPIKVESIENRLICKEYPLIVPKFIHSFNGTQSRMMDLFFQPGEGVQENNEHFWVMMRYHKPFTAHSETFFFQFTAENASIKRQMMVGDEARRCLVPAFYDDFLVMGGYKVAYSPATFNFNSVFTVSRQELLKGRMTKEFGIKSFEQVDPQIFRVLDSQMTLCVTKYTLVLLKRTDNHFEKVMTLTRILGKVYGVWGLYDDDYFLIGTEEKIYLLRVTTEELTVLFHSQLISSCDCFQLQNQVFLVSVDTHISLSIFTLRVGNAYFDFIRANSELLHDVKKESFISMAKKEETEENLIAQTGQEGIVPLCFPLCCTRNISETSVGLLS